jgi:hypothetical protein
MRNDCTVDTYLKATSPDNLQMGMMNTYLNSYAGKLGCNTSKGVGQIKIDYSTFKNIRGAVAAKTVQVFDKPFDNRTNPELDEMNKPSKKKGYNFGGYVPKGDNNLSLIEEYALEKREKELTMAVRAVTKSYEKNA